MIFSWEPKDPKGTPPMPPPLRNNALSRDYQPLVSLNKALLGPHFLGGGGALGVPLDCHDLLSRFYHENPSKIITSFGRNPTVPVVPHKAVAEVSK